MITPMSTNMGIQQWQIVTSCAEEKGEKNITNYASISEKKNVDIKDRIKIRMFHMQHKKLNRGEQDIYSG
jgi:hypothetical protein